MNKDKHRVQLYGEVFTPEREVKAMLDLVHDETQRIDSRFLEPACGNGNFLNEVLLRKLTVVEQRYSKNQYDFEKNAFLAVTSVYGIDILYDNIQECRDRLRKIVTNAYCRIFPNSTNDKFFDCISFVLSKNILWGDALTLLDENSKEPIMFTEWSFTRGGSVKRTEYTLCNLIGYEPYEGDSLFSDLGEEAFIPQPMKTHKTVPFMDLACEI